MEAVFLKVLNMSLIAGGLILAVILLRFVLKKAPKSLRCVMWALVAIRLICPFSFESDMSFIHSSEPISQDFIDDANKGETVEASGSKFVNTGISVFNNAINPIIEEIKNIEDSQSSTVDGNVNAMKEIAYIAAVIWIVGMVLMLIYCVVSYIRVRRNVAVSMKLYDNVYICDSIDTPFILGIIRPRIYLPSAVSDKEQSCIIAHEQAHLKRHDNWWKPLGFILLSVYWFNPLIWVAYILLCRDIELACDERVIRDMGIEEKKMYSEVLLSCSTSRRLIMVTPLAFGEVAVKSRIKSVLNYKKPAFWIIFVGLTVSIVVAIGFMTSPVTYAKSIDDKLDKYVSKVILEHNESEYTTDNFACENHKIMGVETEGDKTIIYTWVLYHEYKYDNFNLEEQAGSHIPTVITVSEDDRGEYVLEEYWEPSDGEDYSDDIRSKFPRSLEDDALDSQLYIDAQTEACEQLAIEHFVNTVDNGNDGYETGIEEQTTASGDSNIFIEEEDSIRYYSVDNMYCIELDTSDNSCYFYIPMASSAWHTGVYELTDTKLILRFNFLGTSEITRVFSRDGDKLVYDISASKQPDIINMRLDDKDVFVLSGSDILQDEIDKLIGDGVMGHKEKYLILASEETVNKAEDIYMGPTIRLEQLDKTFTYSSSMLSSYMIFGEYEYTEDKLILRASEHVSEYDGGEIYVFVRNGDKFVFSLELSTLNDESSHSSSTGSPFVLNEVYIIKDWY